MKDDLSDILDKAHVDLPLAQILKLSPAALKGVSEKDAELLQQAFGIKTVADFGANKFFLRAQGLLALSQSK